MKNLFIFSFLAVLSFFVVSLAMAQTANIAETVVQATEITAQDLGVEDPGMLPTSPFYFLKNWTREVRRIITFATVKKAELELEIINQQAAEIKKIEEIAPERLNSISKAINNYQDNVNRLKNRLETINETSQNPNIDRIMEKLVDRSIKHQELFDDLRQKFEGKENLIQELEHAGKTISDVMSIVPKQFDQPEIFQKRLERIIEKRPDHLFKEMRAAEIISRINENLNDEQKEAIQKTKDVFIRKFEEEIKNLKESEKEEILSPEILNRLPGYEFDRLKIIEEIRQKSSDINLRKRLEIVGDKIKITAEGLTKEKIEMAINEASNVILKLETKISIAPTTSTANENKLKIAKEHLIKAKSNLDEAKKIISTENWRGAFGKAASALVIAKNGLRALMEQIIPIPLRLMPATPIEPTVPLEKININETERPYCIQVITPAISPNGICKEFPTPCDVPMDWKKIDACRKTTEINEIINQGENNIIENLQEGTKSFLNY